MKDSDVVVMERFRGRTLRAAVAYLLATVVAWFSPITGFYLYIAIALVFAFRQIRTKAMERVLRHTYAPFLAVSCDIILLQQNGERTTP